MKKLRQFSKQRNSNGAGISEIQMNNTAEADLNFILKVRLVAAFWFICAIVACGVAFI